MSVSQNDNNSNKETLLHRIQSLEKRLSKIESILRVEWQSEITKTKLEEGLTAERAESKIVEYGLAWLGGIVFLFGIVFLMSYTESLGYLVLSKFVAILLTLLLFAFSYFSQKQFPILANVLKISTPLLLYYIIVRLHFFVEQPLIARKEIILFVLLMVVIIQFYNAIRENSEFFGVIAVFLSITTAVFSDSAYITFLALILTALGSYALFYYKLWWKLYVFSLFMVYLAHLMWLFGNPIMGHQMRLVELPQYSIIFLSVYAIIYAFSIFIPKKKLASNAALISISIWNALWFLLLLLIMIPSFYKESYVFIFSGIALFCILFAVILKLKSNRSFAPATYACFGFTAFSIAVYGYFGLPYAYFLLALQSFLVVSMALWFRSKIIVVANSLLFVFILLVYLITSEPVNLINFAFSFTALGTARILNWQKERLTLQTNIFRYIYLLAAFFMILHSLNQALPAHYVTLAWTATAFGFFLLSILLRNSKYRYLSVLTILVTAGHLFFIDLNQMSVGNRVIAFLVFAIISIGVSLYYTKRIRN